MNESDVTVMPDAESVKALAKKEYQRQYCLQNKERLSAYAQKYSKAYYLRNKEKQLARQKAKWNDPDYRSQTLLKMKEYRQLPESRKRYNVLKKIRRSRPEAQVKIKQSSKEYVRRPEVKKRAREYMAILRRTNPEYNAKRAEQGKKHRASQEYRNRLRKYLNSDAGKAAAFNSRSKRRALKLGNGGSIVTTKQIAELKSLHSSCFYCEAEFTKLVIKTVDHFIPISLGGQHSLLNLVICCKSCNCRKNKTHPMDWLAKIGKPHLASVLPATL